MNGHHMNFAHKLQNFFIELNEFETAAEILDALIEEFDENSEIWFLAGSSYSNFDPEEALQYLLKCKELLKKQNCNEPEILEKAENCFTLVQQKIAQLPPKPEKESEIDDNEEHMLTDEEEDDN